MKQRLLFVRPPRPLWPFNGPNTSFWPPLAFASLAAAVRANVRNLDVAIIDAPILEMGWRSLAAELARQRSDYVGIGEEAVCCVEGLRLARLAREAGARVIAGGCFFGNVAPQLLATGLVDAVVHGEGEVTLVELIEAMRSATDLRRVTGISFREGDTVVRTPPRPLVADLDTLPLPAYDLLPVERYGQQSRNHPQFAAIEASRGCLDSCNFCVLWRQMSDGSRPRLRVKSAARLLEEVRVLVGRHQRRYLAWVDPCFNADPHVPGALAELLLRERLTVGQSAWVRADCLLRDAASGALARCVRAGLNEAYFGIERRDAGSLARLGKHAAPDDSRRALELLAGQYPNVFTVGSLIYGMPGDSPATIRELYRWSLELPLDQVFYIPLTPLPGTPYWDAALWDPTGAAFRRFDFLPFGNNNGQAALDRELFRCFASHWPSARWRAYWRGLSHANARKRRMAWNLFCRGTRNAVNSIYARPRALPAWYEN